MTKMRATLVLLALLIHPQIDAVAGEQAAWTILLHPSDFVIGSALNRLEKHRQWTAGFDDQTGAFDIAVRKQAVAIAPPQWRMVSDPGNSVLPSGKSEADVGQRAP